MTVWPLLLVAAVLAVDSGLGLSVWSNDQSLLILLVATIPMAVVVIMSWLRCLFIARQVQEGRLQSLPEAALILKAARWLLVINALFVIVMTDWLAVVRNQMGNGVLLDELVVLMPVLVGMFMLGLAWFPVEHALAKRQGDRMKGRLDYAWSQFSIHCLLVLTPALIILAIMECVEGIRMPGWKGLGLQLLTAVLVVVLFLAMPLIVRLILAVKPLEHGPLRERLDQVCVRHGVGVRDILLWRTGGVMLNAAVVGLVGVCRYVLLTDTLVRVLPDEQSEAVMAHEIGHVRLRHMPWLFGVIVSLVLLVEAILSPLGTINQFGGLVHLGILLGVVWGGLGWVSRRFEQQADTFAVLHFTGQSEDAGQSGVPLEAIAHVVGALRAVAWMNGDVGQRSSWRHGSIAYRCSNLGKLAGCAPGKLPIDTVVGRIKLTTVIVGVVALAALIAMSNGMSHDV